MSPTAYVRALERASSQHGVVHRRQAIAVGMTANTIQQRIDTGVLVPVAESVYRVRGAPQTERMAIVAASLGSGGLVSHMTSARLMQFGSAFSVVPLHVTADGLRNPRLRRIDIADGKRETFAVRTHRFTNYGEPQVVIDGIVTTDGARTMFDVAPRISIDVLSSCFERARSLGVVSIDQLARRLALIGGRGRPGTAKIRVLLESARPGALESELEIRAWQVLRRSRLPEPVRQYWVTMRGGERYRLDFAWPAHHVAFETEGFEWHGTRARWKQDRVRTAALERMGWRIIVATWDDITRSPVETLDRIAMAVNERAALARRAN